MNRHRWLALLLGLSVASLAACGSFSSTAVDGADASTGSDASNPLVNGEPSLDSSTTEASIDAGPCPGKTLCGGDGGPTTCADLTSDPNNCGACGHFCPSKACANSDCVRRIFVSSVTISGEAAGVTGTYGVDSQCQQLALTAGLDGNYLAWLSNAAISPSSRFTRSNAPYVRTDGTKVANDWNGLTSGTLFVPINRDESTAVVSTSTDVWTDTDANGTAIASGSHCSGWTTTIGAAKGSYGHATSTNATWTNAGAAVACATYNRYYCVEQ
jgi:hypothetical protein